MQRSSQTPDARVAEARVKVSKLEKGLDALEGTSGADGRGNQEGSRESQKPELICRLQGVHRSQTIGEVGGRESVGDRFVEEGRARLAHQEAQVAVGVPMPPAAPSSELEAEVSQCGGVCLREDFVPTQDAGNKKWRKQFRWAARQTSPGLLV